MQKIDLDPYGFSRITKEGLIAIEEASRGIAQRLGVSVAQIRYATSGPDAVHQLYSSLYLDLIRERGRTHILTAVIEDPSLGIGLKYLKALGCHIKTLRVDRAGRLRAEVLAEAIGPRTGLVTLAMSSAQTGVMQPIADLARICNELNVLLHVDLSSAFGKVALSFEDFGLDFLTFDGPLLGGPEGTGGICSKKDRMTTSWMHRGIPWYNGTLLQGLNVAMEKAESQLDYFCTEVARLRQKFEEIVRAHVPEAVLLFADADRLSHIAVIAFPGIASELLAFHLARKGVAVSFGVDGYSLSSILDACGIDPQLSLSALSFALSDKTSEEEIDRAAAAVQESVAVLRGYYA